MFTLRIEHPINDFGAWKKMFDSDPLQREKSGVRRYRILRPVTDQNLVLIDLDFDNANQAEKLVAGLRELWKNMPGGPLTGGKTTIVEQVEAKELK